MANAALLAVVILLTTFIHKSQGTQKCTVKIEIQKLTSVIEQIQKNSIIPRPPQSSSDRLDSLFSMLRRNQSSSLVILMDTSTNVRPHHFFIVHKPMIESLLRYHVDYRRVSVSVISFDGYGFQKLCEDVQQNCVKLEECIHTLTYNRSGQEEFIHNTIIEGVNEAENILRNSNTGTKTILILSRFTYGTIDGSTIKHRLSSSGINVYTVYSSKDAGYDMADELASSPNHQVYDSDFLSKLYNTTIHINSCSLAQGQGERLINQRNGELDCKSGINTVANCMCKLGYSGANCNVPLKYCDDANACPPDGECLESGTGVSYSCMCPKCNWNACMNYPSNDIESTAPSETPKPGPPIAIIASCAIAGFCVIIIVISITCVIRRRPGIIYGRSTSQETHLRGPEAVIDNVGYDEDDEEGEDYLDVENYLEMSKFSMRHRGMEHWESYTKNLLQKKALQEICITSASLDQFCTSNMNFMPRTGELDAIKGWFAGDVQSKDKITYKNKSYRVLTNRDDTIQGLSIGRRNPATRICFSRTVDEYYYIIGLRAKVQDRGDMHICFNVVQDIKTALSKPNEVPANCEYMNSAQYDDVAYNEGRSYLHM